MMDLVEEGDLFQRIMKRRIFPEHTVRRIVWRLLSAVKYMQQRGIVHRDLKPENILCTDRDDDASVLIADFGLSRFLLPGDTMRLACGTVSYIAPEVLRGEGYSSAVDVWSVGVILYVLLRGGLPFDAKSREDVVHRTLHSKVSFRHPRWKYVSPGARLLLCRLLEKDPGKRATPTEAMADPWFAVLARHGGERRRDKELVEI